MPNSQYPKAQGGVLDFLVIFRPSSLHIRSRPFFGPWMFDIAWKLDVGPCALFGHWSLDIGHCSDIRHSPYIIGLAASTV